VVKPLRIWDIGHSNRNLDEFLNLLKKNNIELLIDIRRFPSSQKFPHFNKDNLKIKLEKFKIRYLWLGEQLGGFRKGGYEKWLESNEFKEGLNTLKENARKVRTAIMCAEGYFMRCHRRYIIFLLEKEGWEIIHI
jgi:uncharacterized protein (DUF488 family)